MQFWLNSIALANQSIGKIPFGFNELLMRVYLLDPFWLIFRVHSVHAHIALKSGSGSFLVD